MKWLGESFSLKSGQGPVVWSLLVHLIVGIVVNLVMREKGFHHDQPDQFVDLGYETFDAPPPPAVEEKRVMKIETKPSLTQPAPRATTAHELQDEHSDVTGTQAATQQNPVTSDGEGRAATTPFYKIKPRYPRAALATGVEGWVLMEIDITEAGEVENIRVIDGEQRTLFQSEARRAVAQWRYRPFVDGDGKPYRKVDHQVRVDFRLKEEMDGSSEDRASL